MSLLLIIFAKIHKIKQYCIYINVKVQGKIVYIHIHMFKRKQDEYYYVSNYYFPLIINKKKDNHMLLQSPS